LYPPLQTTPPQNNPIYSDPSGAEVHAH
jgi:hypothetical protein